jgi:hypothetical protein
VSVLGSLRHSACLLCGSQHGSSDRKRRKRKMDITRYRTTCVCSCADGGCVSFVSLSPPLSRGYSVIASKEKHNICHLHADNPIRAGYPPSPNATPRFYAKPFSLHPPPSQTQTCQSSSLEFFYGLSFTPCLACECVSYCSCDVSSTHNRCQVHVLSPSTVSFVPTKISRLLLDLRLTQS